MFWECWDRFEDGARETDSWSTVAVVLGGALVGFGWVVVCSWDWDWACLISFFFMSCCMVAGSSSLRARFSKSRTEVESWDVDFWRDMIECIFSISSDSSYDEIWARDLGLEGGGLFWMLLGWFWEGLIGDGRRRRSASSSGLNFLLVLKS